MLKFDGTKLKKLRNDKNLTQTQLGLLVGKKTADISNYENGIASPPSDTLLNLMTFFKVSAKDLGTQAEEVGV